MTNITEFESILADIARQGEELAGVIPPEKFCIQVADLKSEERKELIVNHYTMLRLVEGLIATSPLGVVTPLKERVVLAGAMVDGLKHEVEPRVVTFGDMVKLQISSQAATIH